MCIYVLLCPVETILREKHQLILHFANVYFYKASIAVQGYTQTIRFLYYV